MILRLVCIWLVFIHCCHRWCTKPWTWNVNNVVSYMWCAHHLRDGAWDSSVNSDRELWTGGVCLPSGVDTHNRHRGVSLHRPIICSDSAAQTATVEWVPPAFPSMVIHPRHEPDPSTPSSVVLKHVWSCNFTPLRLHDIWCLFHYWRYFTLLSDWQGWVLDSSALSISKIEI
jgi:hypothetical protein